MRFKGPLKALLKAFKSPFKGLLKDLLKALDFKEHFKGLGLAKAFKVPLNGPEGF